MNKNELENLWFSETTKVASWKREEKIIKAVKQIVSKCKLPGWKVGETGNYPRPYDVRQNETGNMFSTAGRILNIVYPQVRSQKYTEPDDRDDSGFGTPYHVYSGPTFDEIQKHPDFITDVKYIERELKTLARQIEGGYVLKRGSSLFKKVVRNQEETAVAFRYGWHEWNGEMVRGKFFR